MINGNCGGFTKIQEAFTNMQSIQMNQSLSLTIAAAVLGLLASQSQLRADLILEYLPAFVPGGGNGTIDVTIRSDNLVNGDQLNGGSYFFEITRLSGTGILQFMPTDQQSQSEQVHANYYLAGDIGAANFSSVRLYWFSLSCENVV